MSDVRYLHFRHIEPGSHEHGTVYEEFFPGWIDADAFPWAKELRMPGDCEDLFCSCHERAVKDTNK